MATTMINARIYTGVADRPWASSMTWNAGLIVSVDQSPGSHDEVIDGGGRLITPAFGDGHAHPMFAGFEFLGPTLRGKSTLEQVLSSVAEFAEKNSEVPWIIGGSYESWMVPNGEFDARWLDEIVSDRPVVLHASDYHTVWCNTAALNIAGITAETPDPELGWIVRRADGSPMGTLREWDAVALVLDHAPERPLEERVRALELASAEFARNGTTWVQDAWVDPGMETAYFHAGRTGKLGVRFNLALRADARAWRNQLDWFTTARAQASGIPNVTVNTIKFFADGVIEGRTAAVRGGYHDDPHNQGMPCWDWDELRECVAAIDALGFQAHIHAIGDEGLHEALNAIEFAQKTNSAASHPRPVITHVQLLDPADLPRFSQLGIVANFEPLWACNDPLQSELTAPAVGSVREMWQYPMKTLLKSGANISMGSDWPVTEQSPIQCLHVAVNRTVPGDPERAPWNPAECLTVVEAVDAYTQGNAFQAGEEQARGTLEPGKEADFVVLDRDIFSLAAREINTANVVETWRSGVRIF